MAIAINSDVESALQLIGERPVSRLFLVACGGSLAIMHAGKYLIDRHSRPLACGGYNADEFVCRNPKGLDRSALVSLGSQTGTTAETVHAARHARERGAATMAMTLDPASPLAAE